MPTYRTGAGAFAIQVLQGAEGAAEDVANAVAGSDFSPYENPVTSPEQEAVIIRGAFITARGTGAGEGGATAVGSRAISGVGRPGAGVGGYRANLMPAAKGTVTPGPTIFGGFAE